MKENEANTPQDPEYGSRLSDDELAAHQKKHQSSQSSTGSEYGPQDQPEVSEYGPQGGFASPSGPSPAQPGAQQPGFQQPGFQEPGFQQPPQPGFQQPSYGPGQDQAYGQPPGMPPSQPGGEPQLHPDMTKEPPRPKQLDVAFWSIVTAGIAYFISQLIVVSLPNLGMSDEQVEMLEGTMGQMLEDMPFGTVEAYLNSTLMMSVMIGQSVILLAAYVLVGLGIRNGWRSMRILGTIFAALSLFNLTFASPLAAVVSVIAVGLGILGIIYSWLPASTEYYRQKAWQKAARKAYPEVPSR